MAKKFSELITPEIRAFIWIRDNDPESACDNMWHNYEWAQDMSRNYDKWSK